MKDVEPQGQSPSPHQQLAQFVCALPNVYGGKGKIYLPSCEVHAGVFSCSHNQQEKHSRSSHPLPGSARLQQCRHKSRPYFVHWQGREPLLLGGRKGRSESTQDVKTGCGSVWEQAEVQDGDNIAQYPPTREVAQQTKGHSK